MTETTLVREDSWPAGLRVAQVRVARPTDKLAEVEEFYASHLGLPVLYRFVDHDGFDGVMLGLPGGQYHLEFTVERLAGFGHVPVDADNPYWVSTGALTFEDPDGWRIVLAPRPVVL